jgi:hypothetical protein
MQNIVGSRRWTSRSSDQTQADALIFATVFGKLLFRDLSEHRKATESFLARLDAENTVFIGDAYIYTSATSVVETLQQDEKHLRGRTSGGWSSNHDLFCHLSKQPENLRYDSVIGCQRSSGMYVDTFPACEMTLRTAKPSSQ